MTQSIIRSVDPARKQARVFALVWSFITMMMGAATFLGIYFAYPQLRPTISAVIQPLQPVADGSSSNSVDAPVLAASSTSAPSTPTSQPSATPMSEASLTEQAMFGDGGTAVAQVYLPTFAPPPATPTLPPTAMPTLRPVDERRFEAGIQVQFALSFNPEEQRGYYRSVAHDLKLPWVKQQIIWERFEPQRGQYDWSVSDFVMPIAQEFGLKVVFSVLRAPAWAREAGGDMSKTGPPANPQDYANFVGELLRRYPGQIQAIEVWNEMNIDREWASPRGVNATDYVRLLRPTYEMIKSIDPGVLVITGALAPTGFDNNFNAINDFRYTDLLIAAGALDYADCFGSHLNGFNMPPLVRWDEGYNDPTATFRGPFDNPHHSWSFRSTLEGYAARIRAAGSNMPLCVTEFGWAVAEDLPTDVKPGFEFARDNTLAEQAQWMPQALEFMANSGYVRLGIVWNFNYGPQAGWDASQNDNVAYSLIGPGFNFRPAYDAIREWQSIYSARAGF